MSADAHSKTRVHLLDVGHSEYGDCVLCEVDGETILIDGGHQGDLRGSENHPAIPAQLREILGLREGDAAHISLLVVSHAHDDHIGCLPEMVSQGLLTAEWVLMVDPDLAWTSHDDDDTPAQKLQLLLREEPRTGLQDRIAFDGFASNASRLQQRYRAMIKHLKSNGAKVVLHGKSPLMPLHQRFANIGLNVLGPSNAHIRACFDRIATIGRDFVFDFSKVLPADADLYALYRQFQQTWVDSPDAGGSFGHLLNLQSSILVFGDGTHRFLFTGDSQLEKPGVRDDAITTGIEKMLDAIAAHAPYDFVKLGHHGSHNAFGDKILERVGDDTINFGICAGASSKKHPSPEAIGLLRDRDGATWTRTDRNGRVSYTFGARTTEVAVTRGQMNDPTLPGRDETLSTTAPQATPMAPAVMPVAAPAGVEGFEVPKAISIHIPYVPGSPVDVTVRVTVEARHLTGETSPVPMKPAPDQTADLIRGFRLAAGRPLPPLLFVTHSDRLRQNVGTTAAEAVLLALRAAPHKLVEVGDGELAHDIVARVAADSSPEIRGIVIIGGYDVVPAERRDTLTAALRRNAPPDADNYVVWTDNLYGDTDDDGLPELPVSRIPDGRSAQLLLRALSPPRLDPLMRRHGVRNCQRPFADSIFGALKGGDAMLASYPHPDAAGYATAGDHLYFMLHGDFEDATRFWGELPEGGSVEAVHIDQIADMAGATVFTGCCWGALPVREPAGIPNPSGQVTPRTADDSIALRCLARGALAYVGCTGTHYSPTVAPFGYLGGPMHQAFWDRLCGGDAPAQALFEARKLYAAGIPHRRGARIEALERKLFEQFTVLGLGW